MTSLIYETMKMKCLPSSIRRGLAGGVRVVSMSAAEAETCKEQRHPYEKMNNH